MEETKFVPMFTWVCVCGKEYDWEIEKLTHSGFGESSCLACHVKAGERIPLKVCRCKPPLDKRD